MTDSFFTSVLIGALFGVLSGLGLGGGSLLTLWLTVVVRMDPVTARGVSLLFFIPAASVTCWRQLRSRQMPIPLWLTAAGGGCLSAAVTLFYTRGMDTQTLKHLFGLFILAAGIRELTYRARNVR